MEIPESCFTSTFQRRLKQYACRLLQNGVMFPKAGYDDDLLSLSEGIVQDAYIRIHERPGDNISRTEDVWHSFFRGFIRNIVRERARRTFTREKSLGVKYIPVADEEEENFELLAEALIVAPASNVFDEYENNELEQIFAQELANFPGDEFFRHFAMRRWTDGVKGNKVWVEEKENFTVGYSRVTYFRWYDKLMLGILKRWDPSKVIERRVS